MKKMRVDFTEQEWADAVALLILVTNGAVPVPPGKLRPLMEKIRGAVELSDETAEDHHP